MLAGARIFAIVPTTDLARARRFYGGTLDLPEVAVPGGDQAIDEGQLAFAGADGSVLFIYQRPMAAPPEHTVAGFAVDAFDETVDALIARGVTFEVYRDMPGVQWDERGVADMGGMRGAWFKDPDGNILALEEMPEGFG